jgi:DNA transposition AAA+ family ATPase
MTADPQVDGFVRIGMPELYNSLQRVAEGNQRLEAKVDTALSIQTLRQEHMAKDIARLEAKQIELESYIEAVDRKPVVTTRALITAITATGTVVGIISTVVALVIR